MEFFAWFVFSAKAFGLLLPSKKCGKYSGLNLNQDKATKPQTAQIVRQGEATPYWFKVNPLYNPQNENKNTSRLNLGGLSV